jgi:peptidylprolyl isomerase
MRRGFVRKIPALIVVAGLLATLTACSTSSAPGSAGCTTPASGDAANVVTASGKFGSKPTVKIPTPIVTKHTEVSTLIQGHGQVLTDGTPSLIKYTIYSGATGKAVSSSSYGTPTTPITVGATNIGPLGDALECSQVGSRLAIAVKASELTSTTAKPNDKSGPAYIVVMDVVKAFLPKANGALRPGVNNMPAVVTAANGAPGISVPDIAAPKTEKVQVVRQGNGHTFTKKDTAIVQFTAVDWASTPKVQGSTWTDGDAATTLSLSSSQIPSSIKKAIIGQKVGSQVMVVVPPTSASTSGMTDIYVFDLLGSL